MKKDRLRNDKDEVHNLEDLLDARDKRRSHFSGDIDAFEEDMDIPDDIDVDEALTFPHPKHKKRVEDVDLMDTPHKEDMDEDWDNQDLQPSDYAHGYDEATTTLPYDDMDDMIQEQIHTSGQWEIEDITDEPEIEVMPDKFTPDDRTLELDEEAEEEK